MSYSKTLWAIRLKANSSNLKNDTQTGFVSPFLFNGKFYNLWTGKGIEAKIIGRDVHATKRTVFA